VLFGQEDTIERLRRARSRRSGRTRSRRGNMTDNAKPEPAQVEIVKMDMLTVKPPATRLGLESSLYATGHGVRYNVPRARLITIVILSPPAKREWPPMWLGASGFQWR
jgi:hypothetical protein